MPACDNGRSPPRAEVAVTEPIDHLSHVKTPYAIRPVGEPDLPLIGSWRALSHVSRWWGDASLEPEREKLAEPRIAMWIVEIDARPFAFIQDYDVHGWSPHHFDYLPKGSRGLDAYIGESDMLGRGHGPLFIRSM